MDLKLSFYQGKLPFSSVTKILVTAFVLTDSQLFRKTFIYAIVYSKAMFLVSAISSFYIKNILLRYCKRRQLP